MTEYDVAVIGAGPAGIAAAVRAAEHGSRVVLIDEAPEVGGQIWRHRRSGALPRAANAWFHALEKSGAELRSSTTLFDAVPDAAAFKLALNDRNGAAHLRSRSVIIATGTRERFIPFPGWTRPGVVGIGGAQALLKTGTSFDGKRVVIAGSGPLLLPVASALSKHGANVVVVAEQAPGRAVRGFAAGLWKRPGAVIAAVGYRAGFWRTPYKTGTWAIEARGDAVLTSVALTDGDETREIPCDVLCTGYGLIPNTELPRLFGCALADDSVVVDDRQLTSVSGVYAAGESTGVGGVDLAIVEGEIAGLAAVGVAGDVRRLRARRASLRTLAAAMERAFALRPELRALPTRDTVVCRCEDVRLGAIDAGWSLREAKLYTRTGMGPCQGRICGAALSFLRGCPPDSSRLPVTPATVADLTSDAEV